MGAGKSGRLTVTRSRCAPFANNAEKAARRSQNTPAAERRCTKLMITSKQKNRKTSPAVAEQRRETALTIGVTRWWLKIYDLRRSAKKIRNERCKMLVRLFGGGYDINWRAG
jgi:hypothetical protein